ncbi:hypothetical protein OIU77_021845 [Salix suchowensis]|uniref:Allantoinase composite domain-containing protein n=1 Tax=Salix suchowensis TaxID=1278906 RepID=A0ABQ9CBD4_9ROSI|nr:hypothetical protein OIU77_021845 [Salix suchowensis]
MSANLSITFCSSLILPRSLKESDCSLFPYNHYWIISKRIVTPRGVISGAVEVKEEKIVSIIKEEDWHGDLKREPNN